MRFTSPSIRRARNSLRRLLRPAPVDFIYAAEYKLDVGAAPNDPMRAERIIAFLLSERLIEANCLHRPSRPSLRDLGLGHSTAYLESLRDPGALKNILGVEVGEELHDRALQAQRLAVGGTLLATRRALERRRPAINLGGGFHHARPEAGRGFCIFNDVTVAINKVRGEGFTDNVLVVDLDLHDGNGTRAAFARDPSVFTFSIHNQTWELEPAEGSLTLELEGEVEDDVYLDAIRSHLPDLLQKLRPRLVYYLAGTDPAYDDSLGNWKITDTGMLDRDRFVVTQVRRHLGELPLVVLLAGGYGSNTWRYSARFFNWLISGAREVKLPSSPDITFQHYQTLARALEREKSPSGASADLVKLTEADIYGNLGREARPTRFLGRFTPHGVELLLERTGFMDRLRAKGFRHSHLDFDLHHPAGHTLRIFGDRSETELLMELRLCVNRRMVPDMELLEIAWLLLQNPREQFTPTRRPLPGQNHPGLGLLRDVMSLLFLLSQRLGLDGILFVPSHYHLATTGKKYLRFLQPADEALYRAVHDAVRRLPLDEAVRAVDEGRVVERTTGASVEWRPMPMVLPISEQMHQLVEADEYEARVHEAGRHHCFRLANASQSAAPRSKS